MVIGLSCTPSSAQLRVDGTTVFSRTMGVAASEQEHVLKSQNATGLSNVMLLAYSWKLLYHMLCGSYIVKVIDVSIDRYTPVSSDTTWWNLMFHGNTPDGRLVYCFLNTLIFERIIDIVAWWQDCRATHLRHCCIWTEMQFSNELLMLLQMPPCTCPLIGMNLVCPVMIIVNLYLIKSWRPCSNVATYYMPLVCRCPTKFFYC